MSGKVGESFSVVTGLEFLRQESNSSVAVSASGLLEAISA